MNRNVDFAKPAKTVKQAKLSTYNGKRRVMFVNARHVHTNNPEKKTKSTTHGRTVAPNKAVTAIKMSLQGAAMFQASKHMPKATQKPSTAFARIKSPPAPGTQYGVKRWPIGP
jgi:hypothetical protein